MTPVDANAFLQTKDQNGVTVREHGRGLFLWAPHNAAEGHRRIGRLLRNSPQSSRLILFDLKDVWLARGKHGRPQAMIDLLHLAVKEGPWPKTLLIHALARHARHQGCMELMKSTTVAAMVYILWHGLPSAYSVRKAYAKTFIQVIRSEKCLSRSALTEGVNEHGYTLLHCPMPAELLEKVLSKAEPEDLSLRAKGGILPAEAWLSRFYHPFRAADSFFHAFELLLQRGASLDFSSRANSIPALVSASDSLALVGLLLEHGADPSLSDNQGRTVFSSCHMLGPDLLRKLAERGGDVNFPGGTAGNPILSALEKRRLYTEESADVIITLLELGWDPNVRNCRGETALFFVTKKEIELMVESGADPTAHCCKNRNALISFFRHCRDIVPPACLMVPENLNSLSERSSHMGDNLLSALGWAIVYRVDTSVVLALLEAGADIDGPPGCCPPILCSNPTGRGFTENVKLLIQLGAKLPEPLPPFVTSEWEEGLRSLMAERVGAMTKRA